MKSVAARRKLKTTSLALLLLLPCSGFVSAQGTRVPDQEYLTVNRDMERQGPEMHKPARFRIRGDSILLTLNEAIQLALERNLELSVSRISHEQSELDLRIADTLYDLSLESSISGNQNLVPTIDGLPSGLVTRNDAQAFHIGVSRLVSTGGSLSLDFTNNRATTNLPLVTINPTYNTVLGLTFTQPLLAGRGRKTTEAGLEVARLNTAISEESFELSVTSTASQAIVAYWGLVGAVEQLKVAELGLEQARKLLEQSRLKVEGGLMPPLELVQSEFGVATREEAVILARSSVDASADLLRSLLTVRSPDFWRMPINPETRPELSTDATGSAQSIEQAVALAMRRRPEMRAQALSQDIRELNAYVSDQAVKPRLDLAVGYDLSGVGGTIIENQPVTGTVLSRRGGGVDDSIGQVIDGEFYGWFVGLNFQYTLGNRAAKARRERSQLDVELGLLRQDQLEINIISEVHQAHRALETARLALRSARLSTQLAEKNLEAEQLRFDNGRSTSFRLVDIQTDLNNARSREVTAMTTYRQAQAGLHQATGQLLDELGIEIVN